MPQIDGQKIIFGPTDILAGFHPQYSPSTLQFQQMFQGIAAMRSIDPFRNLGYITPGYAAADVTNVAAISAKIIDAVTYGQYAYLASAGAGIYKLDLSSNSLSSGVSAAHTITGTSVVQQGAFAYNIGSTTYFFFPYNKSTIGDICRLNPATDTYIDDYLTNASYLNYSTGLNQNYPIACIVGDDDIAYIGNANKIHIIDGQNGSNGTFTANYITLPYGYVITSWAKHPLYLVCYAYLNTSSLQSGSAGNPDSFYLGKTRAFFFPYKNIVPARISDLSDNYCAAGFAYDNTIGVFTQGRNVDKTYSKSSKLKIFDGAQFQTVATFRENIPVNGGVDVKEKQIDWLTADGVQTYIYSYGNNLGLDKKLNAVGEGQGTAAGLLKTLSSSTQFASTGTGAGAGLQTLNSNYNSNALFATAYAEPIMPAGKIAIIKSANVYFMTTASGGLQMTLTLRNRTTSVTLLNNLSTITANSLVQKFTTDTGGTPLSNYTFDALKLIIAYASGSASTDAPIVYKVEVEFDFVDPNPN